MILGHFEYALLFSLVALGPDASGRAVRSELQSRTGRDVTHGAVYSVLTRLEERGLVESWFGEETPARGGRRPKHYRITPEGAETLARAHEQLAHLSQGLIEKLGTLAGGEA